MTVAAALPAAERRTILSRLQLGIESLYRVDTQLDVESFLIDENARGQSGVARAPREQLLISQKRGGSGPNDQPRPNGPHSQGSDDGEDELRLGLFLDQSVVANLERNDPSQCLDQGNFEDFCLAVEGVSHFIYVAICAAADRPVSALELELQAEVDKFACCFLVGSRDFAEDPTGMQGLNGGAPGGGVRELTARLYERVTFAGDLDPDERARYRVANFEARRYAATLSRTFVDQDRVPDMLTDLRRFYRFGLGAKLGHIARLAA